MEQEGNIGDGRGEEETIVGFIWETESPSVRVTRLMRPRRERGMADADVPQWALDCCDSTAWRVVRSSRALCAALDAAFALQPAAARPQRPFAAADSRSQRTAAWAVTPVATRDAVQAALNAALACPAVRASTAFRALLWPPSTDAADDGADARADLSADEAREQMLCRVPPLPTVRLYAIQAAGPGGAGQQQQMEAPPPRTIARWRLHVTMVQAAQGLPQGRLYCTVALDKTVWETPAVVDTAPLWNNTHSFYIAENVGTLVFAVRERRVLQRSRCLGTFAVDVARLHDSIVYDEWAPLARSIAGGGSAAAAAAAPASSTPMLHFRIELSATRDFDEFDEFVVVRGDDPEGESGAPEDEAAAEKAQAPEEEITCEVCGAKVPLSSGVRMDDCGYTVCRSCMEFRIKGAVHERKTEIPCPKCNKPLPQWVLRSVLPKEECEAYLDDLFKQAVAAAPGTLYRCPNPKCRCVLERVIPETSTTETSSTDETTTTTTTTSTKMTKEEHYNRYRMRCQGCGTIFCSSCFRIPYHEGYTCEEYEKLLHSVHCRFCGGAVDADDQKALETEVCGEEECQTKLAQACQKRHACGHWCSGVRDEEECPPCLHEGCCPLKAVRADDYCPICWVEDLGSAPMVVLKCGHGVHYACIVERLRLRWQGPLISFGFMHCPTCQALVAHPLLDALVKPYVALREAVEAKALERLESEFPHGRGCRELEDAHSPFYHDKAKYACHRYMYSQCYRCKKPYFAGLRQCQDAAAAADEPDRAFDERGLLCYACTPHTAGTVCPVHGAEYMQYKCRYCCAVASWYCGANLGHFCDACHARQCAGTYLNRVPLLDLPLCPAHTLAVTRAPGADNNAPERIEIHQGDPALCPLHIAHQPNGTRVNTPIGCFMCQQLKSF